MQNQLDISEFCWTSLVAAVKWFKNKKKGKKGERCVVVVGHSAEFKRESSALVKKNLLDSLFHCHPNSTPLLHSSDKATDLETMLSVTPVPTWTARPSVGRCGRAGGVSVSDPQLPADRP